MGADRESLLAAMMLLGSSGFLLSQLQPLTAPSAPISPAPIDPQLQHATSLIKKAKGDHQLQSRDHEVHGQAVLAADRLRFSDGAAQPELARIELVLHLANRGSDRGESWERQSGEAL